MERNVEQIKKDIKNLKEISKTSGLDFSDKIVYLEEILKEEESKKFKSLTPYEKVSISRDIKRPTALDYIILSSFMAIEGLQMIGRLSAVLEKLANIRLL